MFFKKFVLRKRSVFYFNKVFISLLLDFKIILLCGIYIISL